MSRSQLRPIMVGIVMGLVLSVLGFYGSSIAQVPNAPFGNAVELQDEIINQLKQLNTAVKEQNTLLRIRTSASRHRGKETGRRSVNVEGSGFKPR